MSPATYELAGWGGLWDMHTVDFLKRIVMLIEKPADPCYM